MNVELQNTSLVTTDLLLQLLSHVSLFATPGTAAYQASLSFTISWSLLSSCLLSGWCYLTISSSAAPISFRICFSSLVHYPPPRARCSGLPCSSISLTMVGNYH